jgi:cysteinyl-tRNA synthetase
MKLYNTLTRKIEEFIPLKPNQVGLYSCGPTVYDQTHIGNMRTFILTDLLVRTLKFLGYDVTSVMNITDIDDKMIARADKEGISLSELAAKYEDIFFADLAKLNCQPLDTYPRATEHFPEMKNLLNTLVDKGFAYEKEGSVYFDISKFKPYGKLSQLDKRELKTGARVDADEYTKDNPNDFALWKENRPGWHIECSAMSMKYLGSTIDIHIGGVDLIFPHHENEIAQSEAATEKPFVKYFVHGEFIMVNGKKMAKSDNNFYTLKNIEEQGIDPVAYRYLTLSAHYRSKLNFTWESLAAAAKALAGVKQLAYRQSTLSDTDKQAAMEKAMAALNNDLDFPSLLATLHEANNYDLWLAFEPVLGLGLTESAATPQNIQNLVDEREAAKKNRDFDLSDKIRTRINDLGYTIEDTPDGPRVLPLLP